MTAIQMDNPFSIGDLVHIPQGTVLYKILTKEYVLLYDRPMPIKVTEKPTTGYVIDKAIYDFYIIGIGNKEFMIKSDSLSFINGEIKRCL